MAKQRISAARPYPVYIDETNNHAAVARGVFVNQTSGGISATVNLVAVSTAAAIAPLTVNAGVAFNLAAAASQGIVNNFSPQALVGKQSIATGWPRPVYLNTTTTNQSMMANSTYANPTLISLAQNIQVNLGAAAAMAGVQPFQATPPVTVNLTAIGASANFGIFSISNPAGTSAELLLVGVGGPGGSGNQVINRSVTLAAATSTGSAASFHGNGSIFLAAASAIGAVAPITPQIATSSNNVNLVAAAANGNAAPIAPNNGTGTLISQFTIMNLSASTSPAYIRIGLPFVEGDIPSGSVPTIVQSATPIAAQFDQLTHWPDGSLQFAVCHMRDDQNGTLFNGNESRLYSIIAVGGTFNNTGAKTIADITGASDFKVAFANVVRADGTVDTINYTITDAGANIQTLTATISDTPALIGQGAGASCVPVFTVGGTCTALTINAGGGNAPYTSPIVTFTGTFGAGGRLPKATIQVVKTQQGSGAFTLSTNTILNQTSSGVATRLTKYASGPVYEGWEAWGPATDDGGAASFTGSITGTTLTTSSEVGTIYIGALGTGSGVATNTVITAGSSHSWTVSISQNVASTAMQSGTADPHLTGVTYPGIWKKADGTVADIEHAILVQLPWWSVGFKQRLQYDATYKNGASTIQSYAGVIHGYHSQWLTCKTTTNAIKDVNAGRRFWLNQMPTLQYLPDRVYWVRSGVAPPLAAADAVSGAITFSPTSTYTATAVYTPCAPMNVPAQIDATGGSNGRGIFTQTDATAFLSQNPIAVMLSRITALSAHSVPYHTLSNDLRTRPQDGGIPDVSHTIPSQILTTTAPAQLVSNYNFSTTGSNNTGMPIPAQNFRAQGTNNWVTPPRFLPNAFVTAYWATSPFASHASNYGTVLNYMLDGEKHWCDALVDLASNCSTTSQGHSGTPNPLCYFGTYGYQTAFSIPNYTYLGNANMNVPENQRATGWALGLFGAAAAFRQEKDALGNAYPDRQYLSVLNQQNTRYCGYNRQFLPSSQITFGTWITAEAQDVQGMTATWHDNFCAYGAFYNYAVTRDPDMLQFGMDRANSGIGIFQNRPYRSLGDHIRTLPVQSAGSVPTGGWQPGTNECINPSVTPYYGMKAKVTAGSSTLTAINNIVASSWFGMDNGAVIVPGAINQSDGGSLPCPTELSQTTTYYLCNLSITGATANNPGVCTFQLCTLPPNPDGTPNGTVVAFLNTYNAICFSLDNPKFAQTPAINSGGINGYSIPSYDNFGSISRLVLTYAAWYGNAQALSSYNLATTFLSNMTANLYAGAPNNNQLFMWTTAIPS